MKIVMIIPSLDFGGAERVSSILANHFCESNEVTIITNEKKDKEYSLDGRIRRISLKSNFVLKKMFEIRKIVKVIKPDFCIVMLAPQYTYVYFALLGLHIKQIVSERNDPVNFSGRKITKFIYQTLLKKADGIVFQTTDALKYYYTQKCSKCIVIPNPIILNSLPAKYIGQRCKKVVNVGRLHEQKNQVMLIEAFARAHSAISNFKLEIYGDGPLKSFLQSEIHKRNADDYIYLRGTTSKLFDEIIDSSLFILSSNYEGMPNALIEALCLGIPCISTDCPCGGPRELIDQNVSGRLVPVKDVDSMEKSIIELLTDVELRNKFSEKGFLLRNRLDSDVIASKWIDFCKSVCN